jgi:hypothetical protein
MPPEKNTKIAQMKRALRHIEALAEILAEPAVPSVHTLIVEELTALLRQATRDDNTSGTGRGGD